MIRCPFLLRTRRFHLLLITASIHQLYFCNRKGNSQIRNSSSAKASFANYEETEQSSEMLEMCMEKEKWRKKKLETKKRRIIYFVYLFLET